MNPDYSDEPKPVDDSGQSTELHFTAAQLDVHRHERLDYTEKPLVNSAPPAVYKWTSALLKAFYHWVLSR
jgi:hypothetical protein